MANTYEVGDTIKLTGTFTDLQNPPGVMDPDRVKLVVRLPTGVKLTKLYDGTKTPPVYELTRLSTGVFQYRFLVEVAGIHLYQFHGETDSPKASETVTGEFLSVLKIP